MTGKPLDAESLLRRLVDWAGADSNVQMLVLVGSRARRQTTDALADIDVQVYAQTHEPYTQDQGWLSEIGRVWVCVRDEYSDGGIDVPTRLVIFEGGVKVDFAFYPAGAPLHGIRSGSAHRILLDRDGALSLPRAASAPPAPRSGPTNAEFTRTVEEFFFEAYHVAKYLAREELWLARSRDWATKELLMKVIEWRERPPRAEDEGLRDTGQGLDSWVGTQTREELMHTFGGFNLEEGWRALHATMELFRRLAVEMASARRFTYSDAVDGNLSALIGELEAQSLR